MVLESSTSEASGGYRVSVWTFSRASSVGLVSHEDLDLQQNCLSLCILGTQPQATSLSNPLYNMASGQLSSIKMDGNNNLAQVYLTNTIQFLTVEKSCIKMWEMA